MRWFSDSRCVQDRPRRPSGARRTARRRGFTLIETALTTVIIGVGVLALVEAQQAFMRSNAWSTSAATGAYLANEIREMTRSLPRHDPVTGLYIDGNGALRGWGPEAGEVSVQDFDDLDDFDGITLAFNGTDGMDDGDLPGPIDAFGEVIPEISADGQARLDAEGNPLALVGWFQRIRVEKVDPTDPSVVYADGAVLNPATGFNGLAVNRFPLRVTVTVLHQGPYDAEPSVAAELVWILPD